MKKILMLIILNIFCFAEENINTYLNNLKSLNSVVKINVWHNSDNPGVLKIDIDMYNRDKELVSFVIYQEVNVPVANCTFKIEREKGLLSFHFDFETTANKLLSEKGKYKYITNLFYKIESQIDYIYNKGE